MNTDKHGSDLAAGALPCPFCGGEASIYHDGEFDHRASWFGECGNGECPVFAFVGPETSRHAVLAKWNRRDGKEGASGE